MAGENYINHVGLVLDESLSMSPHRENLIRVADGQIKYLARRSQELDQETRVTVYTFSNQVKCLIYDKDALRLPSIRGLYRPSGATALIDATLKSLDDLSLTPEIYGDHAFLNFVLTDGQENVSGNHPTTLKNRLHSLPAHWTVAVLVPDQRSKFDAQGFGFAPENIAVWDPSNSAGIEEVGKTIRDATENFMVARSRGVRGTRSLFSTGVDAVNRETVTAHLTALRDGSYYLIPVHERMQIRPFIESRGMHYHLGKAYYQLMKTEHIQGNKQIAVREKSTNRVYTGPEARSLLGLPNETVKVKPDQNPLYDVFVQSTSVNRNLIPNTDVLVLR
jgi:hypothetical protein